MCWFGYSIQQGLMPSKSQSKSGEAITKLPSHTLQNEYGLLARLCFKLCERKEKEVMKQIVISQFSYLPMTQGQKSGKSSCSYCAAIGVTTAWE